MKDFNESIPPSRRIFRNRLSASRIAEIGFGWLAKGTMVVAVAVAVVLCVMSDGSGLSGLPSTRRQWLILLLLILLVIAGVFIYFHFFLAEPTLR